MLGRAVAVVACLAAVGCGGSRSEPSPSTTGPPTSVSTTRPRIITSEPIPGLESATVHGDLERAGFITAEPSGGDGFVTIISKRDDATVSTYGRGPGDVVKIVAEAAPAVAPTVLAPLAAAAVTGPEARRAESWVKTELRKGPSGPTETHAAKATFGRLPYELLVTSRTATLSIGRISG